MLKQKVTFMLPGDGRSGGVRVTVTMANHLLLRGYPVRIVLPQSSHTLLRRLWVTCRRGFVPPDSPEGFLHEFKGPQESYRNPNDLTFIPSEVVISVGTYTVPDLRRIRAPVVKARYNHGFPAAPDAKQVQAWQGRLPTITVSNTLVPRLQEITEGSVCGVVPNGIDTGDYFMEDNNPRDGLGALYSRHPNKAPRDLIAVLAEANARWPKVPQFVFGTEPRPRGLEHVTYTQLPSVSAARAIYNRCQTWVLTSLTEGLPGVVLEAMACGCVVVSTDNDGSLEIIEHDRNGLIAPRGDRERILEQISQSFRSDTLRERLRRNAEQTVRRFTWEAAADRMEEFLQHVARLPAL